MSAIKITQEIKDKNAKYNIAFVKNNAVGTIVKRGFPNKFHVTAPCSGGYATRTDLHDSDGWKTPIMPVYNSATQRLGTQLLEVGNDFTYPIINLSQQEIDDLVIANEDAEDEAEVNSVVEDGLKLINRTRKRLIRRVKKGLLNNSQEEKVREAIFDAFVRLSFGSWDLAKNFTDAIPTHNNTKVEEQIQWFKTQINNYLNL